MLFSKKRYIYTNTEIMKRFFLTFSTLLFSVIAFSQTRTMPFKAKIENRNSDSLTIRNRTFSQTLKADKNGVFKGDLAIEDGFYQLFDGKEQARVYFDTDFDIQMTMDASQFDETIAFTGEGAGENNFLAKAALNDEQYDYDTLLNASPDKFQELFDARREELLSSLKGQYFNETFLEMYQKMVEQNMKGLEAYYRENQGLKEMIGQDSPTFEYENYKGGTTSLSDFEGKYIYIDVWATWCGPCRAEIPHLQKLEEHFKGVKTMAFVSISVDKQRDHSKWKDFVAKNNLGGEQLFADNDWNSEFVQEYKISGIPRFIIVGPDGKIVDANASRPSSPNTLSVLEELVGKK